MEGVLGHSEAPSRAPGSSSSRTAGPMRLLDMVAQVKVFEDVQEMHRVDRVRGVDG